MLKKYKMFIKEKEIPYYWSESNNMIGDVKPDTLINIGNKLNSIIEQIEKNIEDPFIAAEYFGKPLYTA